MVDDARIRLLDAAGPVFAEKGFVAATIREICGQAGLNVASVNYYFGDKERLYIETVKRARQAREEKVPTPELPIDATPETRLRSFITTLITRMLGSDAAPWQSRLMMREVLRPTKACQELVREYFRPDFDRLMNILDAVVPAETSSHVRQQIGFSIVGQCLFYRVAGEVVGMIVEEEDLRDHFKVEQLAEHITTASWAMLGQRPFFDFNSAQANSAHSGG